MLVAACGQPHGQEARNTPLPIFNDELAIKVFASPFEEAVDLLHPVGSEEGVPGAEEVRRIRVILCAAAVLGCPRDLAVEGASDHPGLYPRRGASQVVVAALVIIGIDPSPPVPRTEQPRQERADPRDREERTVRL
ncbi:MAG TPA: hypothetical protein VJ872_11800 [Nocardioides sp.]|nr:hypothetical protein [Nocardioides sp.]